MPTPTTPPIVKSRQPSNRFVVVMGSVCSLAQRSNRFLVDIRASGQLITTKIRFEARSGRLNRSIATRNRFEAEVRRSLVRNPNQAKAKPPVGVDQTPLKPMSAVDSEEPPRLGTSGV